MFHEWSSVNPDQALSLLKALQEFFNKEEKWIEWPLAMNDKDIEVKSNDPTATKFSLLGACELITRSAHKQPLADCVDCATREFLDDLSGGELIKGKMSYAQEMELIIEGIKELETDATKQKETSKEKTDGNIKTNNQ